jgi:hypothetical protein
MRCRYELIQHRPIKQSAPYLLNFNTFLSSRKGSLQYVINFGDMAEDEARKYPDLMSIVEEKVKPSRIKQNREIRSRYWWRFGENTPALFRAIAQCDRVLVISAQAYTHFAIAFQPSNRVFSHALVVLAVASNSSFCTIQSRIHEIWARFFSGTAMDLSRYNPSDCFLTFPFPPNWEVEPNLEAAGTIYYNYRAELMVKNDEGLTDTYHRFHDPEETDPAILKLRDLHTAMDKAVLTAYGWPDIDTTCEFILDYEDEEDTTSKRKKPYRYRWPQAVHDEVLARLLTLNQQRYDQETLIGKGADKKSTKRKAAGGTKKGGKAQANKSPVPATDTQLALIPEPTQQLDVWSTIEPSET